MLKDKISDYEHEGGGAVLWYVLHIDNTVKCVRTRGGTFCFLFYLEFYIWSLGGTFCLWIKLASVYGLGEVRFVYG
jgi:hypothetical protein